MMHVDGNADRTSIRTLRVSSATCALSGAKGGLIASARRLATVLCCAAGSVTLS
jgi:hypothetical protein